MKIETIKELKEILSKFNDNDRVMIELMDGDTSVFITGYEYNNSDGTKDKRGVIYLKTEV